MSTHIFVVGNVGVGKSTLVKALVGENVSKTGDSVFSVIKNGILINICDISGLANIDLEDDDTLQNALQECRRIDLFLFCMKMTERLDRTQIEQIKTITRIFGLEIWKKVMFVLTFANTYKLDQKKIFVDKVEEWTRELKMRISNIIGPELGNKVPVIPAGHEAPELPDRKSWISEFWIQGFRRMGFRAMVKLYIQQKLHSTEMKLSQEMSTTPEEQPLIACHMKTEEAFMSEYKMRITGLIVGGIIGHAIALTVPCSAPYVMHLITAIGGIVGDWTMLNYFGSKKTEIVDCYEEAIVRQLILAFYEEYPEYVNDNTDQKVKDELDFNNKDKAVINEEL